MKPHFKTETINYYECCAERYVSETLHLDLREIYSPFLEHLPAKAKILDVGCGSGRDSLYFLEKGFDVTAIDATAAMCRMASQVIGREVAQMRFDQINWRETFDGVWCCAALLHVPKSEIEKTFEKLFDALKIGGVLFISLKQGVGEKIENGRFFAYYQWEEIERTLSKFDPVEIIRFWRTGDVRETNQKQVWLNSIATRKF